MEFYYPNFLNDMWRIMGHIFFADRHYFVEQEEKAFRLSELKDFLCAHHIALYDTCTKIVRTKNTASDKDLQVVELTDFEAMLRQLPHCRGIFTAGQLATNLFCSHFGIEEPRVGGKTPFVFDGRKLHLYRMPSTSRAYPLALEKKAEYYRQAFAELSIIK